MVEDHRSTLAPDRHAFGHWLSGFVDGEGSFGLRVRVKRPGQAPTRKAGFEITLRSDDRPILQEIRSYWGCGLIWDRLQNSPGRERDRPTSHLKVEAIGDLATVLVPHFERYPLRAKKRRDFAIWREGVLMLHTISQRPQRRGSKQRDGFTRKWTAPEEERFLALVMALRAQRVYQAAVVPLPPAGKPERGLFD